MEYPVSYNVINHSGSEIKVIFNGLTDNWMYSTVVDSIVYVTSGGEKTLFISTRDNGIENPETGATISAVKTIRVYRNDTVESTSDFTETMYWMYRQLPKTRGEMNLEVKPTDFSP